MGYSESSKAYRIYFPRFKKINLSRDVTFNEYSAYNKSRKRPVEDSKEIEVPRIQDTTMNDANQDEYREIEEPQEPVESTPREEFSQEETFLGMRSYPRCKKIWGSRRDTQRKEKNQVLLRLCSPIM